MTVVLIEEQEREGHATVKQERGYTRKFHAYSDNPADGPIIVTAAVGVSFWDVYDCGGAEIDAGASCTEIECPQESKTPMLITVGGIQLNAWRWLVTIKYKHKLDLADKGQDPASEPKDPTARNPVWKFGFQVQKKPVQYDLDFKPYLNSSKMPFVPPVEVDWPFFKIDITKNYLASSISVAWLKAREKSVNNDSWNGLDPYTVLCDNIETGDTQIENRIAFYAVKYTLLVHPDVWHPVKILDQGTMELSPGLSNGDKPRWVAITDDYGMPITDPVPFDGNGKRLAVGAPVVFLNFRQYTLRSFSDIP